MRMNTAHLSISNFKCFEHKEFCLPELTVLTGSNASGKSTVIQALLLAHYGMLCPNGAYFNLEQEEHALRLNSIDDIINDCHGANVISVKLDNIELTTDINDASDDGREVKIYHNANNGATFAKAFVYLNAERVGPRTLSPKVEQMVDNCGCIGQFTAQNLYQNDNAEVDPDRWLTDEDGRLKKQLDDWTDYIFPGVTIRSVPDGDRHYKLMPRKGSGNNRTAPNIGFGITYALPILIDGLLVKKYGWFVVENPEAHLHAKAQSNMGFFLGKVAASGVRVIVETHSEHIVNGIRRALLSDLGLTPEMIAIYFLTSEDKGINVTPITIDSNGNLSAFPVDFFDQARQDLKEMLDLISEKK